MSKTSQVALEVFQHEVLDSERKLFAECKAIRDGVAALHSRLDACRSARREARRRFLKSVRCMDRLIGKVVAHELRNLEN